MSGASTPPPLRVIGPTAIPAADWETVYRQHVATLYHYVYARTGNRADAEDVTSATFMRALPRLRANVSDGEMGSYLRATARTVVADLWRDRHGVITSDVIEETAAESSWQSSSDAEAGVERVLEGLPDNYRTVLELRFLRGYTIKETAAAMGITAGNAKVLQLRALRRAAGTGYGDAAS